MGVKCPLLGCFRNEPGGVLPGQGGPAWFGLAALSGPVGGWECSRVEEVTIGPICGEDEIRAAAEIMAGSAI